MTMTPDTVTLFEQSTFASQVVPTVTYMLKATTSEEVDALVDRASKYMPGVHLGCGCGVCQLPLVCMYTFNINSVIPFCNDNVYQNATRDFVDK